MFAVIETKIQRIQPTSRQIKLIRVSILPAGERSASNTNQCINTVGNEGGEGVDGYSGASPDHPMGEIRDEMERRNGTKSANKEGES